MAVTITKPEINVREKLKELDFETVPFQKMPSGSVLQVVSNSFSDSTAILSTSYQNVNNSSASITPTSTSSKIIVMAAPSCFVRDFGTSGVDGDIRIMRNNAQIKEFGRALFLRATSSGVANLMGANILLKFLDSPNTTSLVTYSLEAKVNSTTDSRLIFFNEAGNETSTITLMEIAG